MRRVNPMILLVLALSLSACAQDGSPDPELDVGDATERDGIALRLGDVDPDTPARRTQRLLPLAEYLAGQLSPHGVTKGTVVIARDMEEMGRLLAEGEVDLYLDSAFPTLIVQEASGARTLLRRWAQDVAEYKSLFVSREGDGFTALDQLPGSVLALQEEYSTSGFLLPAGTLADMGFELLKVSGPGERPTTDKIHYFFTRDEENTIELVSTGRVAAGAISDQEYRRMPAELRGQLRVLGESRTVPRQLVSVREDLDPALVEGIATAMLALAPGADPPVALEASPYAWTWKFDEVPAESLEGMEHLRELVKVLEIQ